MNIRHGRFVVVLASFLGAALAFPASGSGSDRARITSDGTTADASQELLQLVRRSRDLAEQANAGLQRSVEQNQDLQRLLRQTRQELLELRDEVDRLRSSLVKKEQGEITQARVDGGNVPEAPRSAPEKVSNEVLASRLMRMEEQVEVNTAQIKEQAQTKVESDSRFGMRIFGTVLFNSFYNSHDTAEEAVPTAAPAASVRIPNDGGNLGATLRQTTFGFAMSGPRVGSTRLSANVDFDFYGGAAGVYSTNALGALRMRTAQARLDGRKTSLAVGLMEPMISPRNPTSLAAVYYPPLGESGNLWQWKPQATVERSFVVGETGKVALQGGVMMPSGENFYGNPIEGKPGYESRIAFVRTLDGERRLEIGAGGYIDAQQFGFGRIVNSYAATGDWVIPINNWLEARGEAYFGQSITLSEAAGGNISEFYAYSGPINDPRSTFRGIHSLGGWIELRARATPRLEFNGAFGLDDPRNRDIFSGLYTNTVRLRNRTFSLNSIYRLRSNFLLAFEYRHLSTVYPDVSSRNNHFNLAAGYAF